MTIRDVVTLTDKGLFIPHAVYESFGEIEIVRLFDSIIIQPKSEPREQFIQLLQQTGLIVGYQLAQRPEKTVSCVERAELAHKFNTGRPLSELIIEERGEQW